MGGLQGFFKGAMMVYFVICGIGIFSAATPNHSIAFAVLFFLGIVFFPIVWIKFITKLPTKYPEEERQGETQ